MQWNFTFSKVGQKKYNGWKFCIVKSYVYENMCYERINVCSVYDIWREKHWNYLTNTNLPLNQVS